MEQNEAAFQPWEKHRPGIQNFRQDDVHATAPYSKTEVLAYARYCQEKIDRTLNTLDLNHPESGYSWYTMPKLEHQIVNIRHIQHHAAQLIDRLRNEEVIGSRWLQKGGS